MRTISHSHSQLMWSHFGVLARLKIITERILLQLHMLTSDSGFTLSPQNNYWCDNNLSQYVSTEIGVTTLSQYLSQQKLAWLLCHISPCSFSWIRMHQNFYTPTSNDCPMCSCWLVANFLFLESGEIMNFLFLTQTPKANSGHLRHQNTLVAQEKMIFFKLTGRRLL